MTRDPWPLMRLPASRGAIAPLPARSRKRRGGLAVQAPALAANSTRSAPASSVLELWQAVARVAAVCEADSCLKPCPVLGAVERSASATSLWLAAESA